METETHTDQDVLYELILNQVPAPKRPMLSTAWSKDYLHRLTSLPASALHNEPAKLREEQLKVERDMSELAFRDYKAFIHVKDAKDEVHTTLDSLSQHLAQFQQHLPALTSALHEFTAGVQPILERQHVYSAILACHSQLLEVLEIPLLMETCVRNGYYHEALELASHVQRLVVRYPGIGIIQGIETKVAQGKERMLVQLLAQLREPIKLPAALKIVGFLRRMGHFEPWAVSDALLMLDQSTEKGANKKQDRKSKKHYAPWQLHGRRRAGLGRRRGGDADRDEQDEDEDLFRTDARKGRNTTTTTTTSPSSASVFGGAKGMGFSEPEDETPLKMLFLKSRQAYMGAQLAKIVLYKGDSFGYLKKYIDTTRDCLYEITSQYRSIFGGEEHYEFMTGYNPAASTFSRSSPAATSASGHGSTSNSSGGRAGGSNHTNVESYFQKPHCWTTEALLSDFVTDRVQALIQVLDLHIPQIQDTSALSSLLTQLMYCGANLSRVGVDLRYLVTSLFEDAVLRVVGSAFQKATLEFLDGLGGDGRAGPDHWLLPSQWMVTSTTAATRSTTTGGSVQRSSPASSSPASFSASTPTGSSGSSLTPQTILMDYPSLAYLTNGLLAALNALRLLAPLSLARPLRMVLQECLLRVEQGLDDYDVAIFGGKDHTGSVATAGSGPPQEGAAVTAAAHVKGKVLRLEAPQVAAEQRLMDGYVMVYQRAVRDYILKCFDEGIYGGLVLHEDEDDEEERAEAIPVEKEEEEEKKKKDQEANKEDKEQETTEEGEEEEKERKERVEEQAAVAEVQAQGATDTNDIANGANIEEPESVASPITQEPDTSNT